MTNQPTLVIMAAGLGSRFGGLKQMTAIDDDGRFILDYSIADAYQAGFREFVCVINPATEADFVKHFARTQAGHDIRFAYQTLDGVAGLPSNRVKPLGTAHAVLSAREYIPGNFAVINADDYYGKTAYSLVYNFLQANTAARHCMVGYHVENTLSEYGSVKRGICHVLNGKLLEITETTDILPGMFPDGTIVSMNMWGFHHSMLAELEKHFELFLADILQDPQAVLTKECYLTWVVDEVQKLGGAEVYVLPTPDKWHGITHAADLEGVRVAIAKLQGGNTCT